MNNIISIREQLNIGFEKPNINKLKEFIINLDSSKIAQDYLIGRGLSSETIKNFKLGYCEIRNAIVIPVFKKNELINLRYRHIDKNKVPKYSQEKGCEVWLYNEEGLDIAMKKGWLLIVEGEFDLMSCWQMGFKNIISPASGKDSYMKWIEKIDAIPKIAIAYDNDKPGKKSALELAEKIGVEKCKEVIYPDGYKDANEYFTKHISDDLKKEFTNIINSSSYFYKYTYTDIGDIIKDMFEKPTDTLKLDIIPHIEFEDDWMVIVSGDSGVGKTGFVLNVAKELSNKNIPVLVFPFERGIKSVGKRYLNILFDKTNYDFYNVIDEEKKEMFEKVIDETVYFSLPKVDDIQDTIRKAKRIFGVKFVIIDHLDYMVRNIGENYNQSVSKTLQEYKLLAQQESMIFLIVHHIKKPQATGIKPKRPQKEDLKGAASIYQDPEAVIMLYRENEHSKDLEVIVVKNKGEHGYKKFDFNTSTGVLKSVTEDMTGTPKDEDKLLAEF